MRVTVFSDIHGNLSALQAALIHAEKQGFDALWFLGDLFGRGPLPIACYDLLKRREPEVWLMGNHDKGMLLLLEGHAFESDEMGQYALERSDHLALLWHAAQAKLGLCEDDRVFLRERLGWERPQADVAAAHGAVLSPDPHDPKNYGPHAYTIDEATRVNALHTVSEMEDRVRSQLPRILLVGHTHVAAWTSCSGWGGPYSWDPKTWGNGGLYTYSGNVETGRHPLPADNSAPLFICPGSIGAPRYMGNGRFADYAILDFEKNEVVYHRVPYEAREEKIASILVPKHTHHLYTKWWALAQQLIREVLYPVCL